jgi:hypothetical protein
MDVGISEEDRKALLMLAILARGEIEAATGEGISVGRAFAQMEKKLEIGKVFPDQSQVIGEVS